ncbi:hypothetical protein OG453_03075 [Streptomyces sp. NBC_01381]|uniref:hypothetical protein n=1 Tax=Streptomyces sp. NBC_01381 TaxID=2903845 RepID=UPI0022554D46|nr:hypothetical protein [Streptomyces sp. NBC_01381]MCX4665664.1 hypothetical protein [Streptomyces sp. NBC_01381]
MRATRRTFRTAAIATGAIAALAVPTTAAFAADAPSTPQDHQVATDDQGQDQGQDQAQDPGQDQDTNPGTDTDTETPQPGSWESKGVTDLGKGWTADVEVNASARTAKASISLDGVAKGSLTAYESASSTTIDGNTFTLTPDGTATAKLVDKDKDKDKDKPVPGGWVSKGVTNLGNGWAAKVDVNASARTAKASISLNGTPKGSLKAYINPASTKIDGCTFTLSADGTITKKAAPKPKPKPQPDGKRVYVRSAKLADGSLAKIYKLGKNHYQADIYAHGAKLDTLDANGKSVTGRHNGLYVVLNPDGTIKSWVEGKAKPAPKPQPTQQPQHKTGSGTSTPVVPKGGVKAGSEGVTPAAASTPLIAAGGGMAALGAAGLGFALYRRKQND